MPKISVIIPVYNTEKYLKECVDSVLNQSFRDFEVILVDDGSIDSSPQICDEYVNKDNRVSVFHKENEGLSMARNDGLAHSKGDFILFLDSDDFWMGEDFLGSIVDFAKSKNDDFSYIEFNRSRFYPSENSYSPCPSFPPALHESNNVETVITELVKHGLFPMSACTKLLNREFLIRNNITFIKGIFSEDIPWFMDLLRKADRPIYYYNVYYYGNRAEVSTSLTTTFSAKKYQDVIDIIYKQITLIKLDKWSDNVKESLYSFLAYRLCILLAQYAKYKKVLPEDLRESTKQLSYLLNYDIHPKVKKTKKLYRFFGLEVTAFVLMFYMEKRDSIKKN